MLMRTRQTQHIVSRQSFFGNVSKIKPHCRNVFPHLYIYIYSEHSGNFPCLFPIYRGISQDVDLLNGR